METKTNFGMYPDRKPDCKKCKPYPYETVIDENLDFFNIISKFQNFIFNGMGGLNPDGLRLILQYGDIEDVDIFIKKYNIYCSNALRVSNEKTFNITAPRKKH